MPGFAPTPGWVHEKNNSIIHRVTQLNPAQIRKIYHARFAFQKQSRLAFMILSKLLGLISVLVLAFFPAGRVLGQSPVPGGQDATFNVYPPVIGDFPTIRVGFELYDAARNFVDGIEPGNVSVLEDERSLPIQSLVKIQPGIQFTVAFNAGPSLGMVVGKQTFFDKVMLPLQTWAESRGKAAVVAAQDDFSFATQSGIDAARLQKPEEWLTVLKNYKPDLEKTQPNLVSLTQALDQATDSAANPRIRRTILYITPALPRTVAANLANVTNRARQVGVRVHIWLISPTPTPDADSTTALRALAEQTGGQFFVVTSANNPPDVESLLAPQRNMYELAYTSSVRESGNHKIAVHVDVKGKKAVSRESLFTLSLQPPNPIFLSPPNQVKRLAGSSTAGSSTVVSSAATAAAIPLSILVEFPDGFERPLKATRLYVDGVLTAENIKPAFDRFFWIPSSQSSTRRHTLRVEVEDVLGMTRSSIEVPVEVISEAPARLTVLGTLSSYGLVAMGAMFLGGAVVAYVLISGRRPLNGRLGGSKKKKRPAESSPLPAAVVKPDEHIHQPFARLAEPVAWLRKQTPGRSVRAQARLMRVGENGEVITGSQLPINLREITIGSDARQVDYFIDAPCVDKIHATLYHRKKGEYFLVDGGSIAGTWVNYNPLSSQGKQLVHGDMVHFGRVAFRFEENTPTRQRQLIVVSEEGK